MNALEAIALMRAQEQVSVRGSSIRVDSGWATQPNDRSRTARQLLCACGKCRRCKNRIAMRQYRALAVKPSPRRRGPSMALGRTCRCGKPVADWSKSGLCDHHRRIDWEAVNRSRAVAA